MRTETFAVVAAVLAVGMAGCVGGHGTDPDPAPADAGSTGAPTEVGSTERQDLADRPHVHDRWEGKDRKVLLDGTVTTGSALEQDPHEPLIGTAFCVIFCSAEAPFGLPDGKIVPPGTDRVRVEASWDDPMAPGARLQAALYYQPADESSFKSLPYHGSGRNWTIDTTVEMADDGHAVFSLWRFRLVVCVEMGDTCLPRALRDRKDLDVRLVAHRVDGPLPREPAHPDWWGNGSSRTIHRGEGGADALGASWVHVGTDGEPFPAGERLDGDDHGIVPPGSDVLTVEINWTNEARTDRALPVEPWLQWNNGRSWEWRTWEPSRNETGRYVYVLPLTPDMVDGMYAGRSRWRFRYAFLGQDTDADEPVLGSDLRLPYRFDGNWTVEIQTHSANASLDGL